MSFGFFLLHIDLQPTITRTSPMHRAPPRNRRRVSLVIRPLAPVVMQASSARLELAIVDKPFAMTLMHQDVSTANGHRKVVLLFLPSIDVVLLPLLEVVLTAQRGLLLGAMTVLCMLRLLRCMHAVLLMLRGVMMRLGGGVRCGNVLARLGMSGICGHAQVLGGLGSQIKCPMLHGSFATASEIGLRHHEAILTFIVMSDPNAATSLLTYGFAMTCGNVRTILKTLPSPLRMSAPALNRAAGETAYLMPFLVLTLLPSFEVRVLR